MRGESGALRQPCVLRAVSKRPWFGSLWNWSPLANSGAAVRAGSSLKKTSVRLVSTDTLGGPCVQSLLVERARRVLRGKLGSDETGP